MDMTKYNHTIKDYPEEERPREKLIRHGAASLSTAELLAIIIRTGNQTHTAVSLSHAILSHFGGLPFLADVSPRELQEMNGIGMAKAAQILAAIEFSQRLSSAVEEKPIIQSPRDVARVILPRMSYLKQEVFETAILDSKSRLICMPRIYVGSLNTAIIHPREVFKPAIKNSAAAIILAHNHPSGDPEPSPADVGITERLVEAGKILGIKVLDHIIIGSGRFVSLKEKGFL